MSSGYQWGNPGDDLTRNNRFSRLLLQQDVNAAPIRSHPQGLASLLRQGMAGFMMGADRREGREASEATSRGMTAEPWTDPDTGETVGTAGGFEGAISALQKLPGNEHAQRSLQGLLMQRMETQAATAARDEERSYAELQRPIYEIVENPLGRGGVGKVDQFGNLSNYQGPAKAAVPTLTSIFDEQGLEQKGYMGEGGGFTPVGGAKAQGGSETRPTAKDANGVLRYLDDGKRVFDQETVGPALPDEGENFDRETKLRREFITASKDYVKVRDAWGRIQASARDPSAAGDLALIFNYMKVLDPGSTVREGEFATAQNSASIPNRLRAQYNQVIAGERLAPEQRDDFVSRASALYAQQESFYQGLQERYGGLAEQYGLDPARVIYDMSARVPEYGGDAATAAQIPADISEDDIQATMKANNMTREQVLQALGIQ